jgi:hypothetical protein
MTESTNILTSGVNREEAKSIIENFLNNKDYKVLAVKGKWGVGKTYLVQELLDKYKQSYYLYASVFGISSIEQLKARILANYQSNQKSNNQNSQSPLKSSINWFNKWINKVFEWFNRNSGRLEKTPKLDLVLSGKSSIPIAGSLIAIAGDLLLEILFNSNIKDDSIICIDDIERKSNLPLDELLGFVEYLVQEFKCKFILIYNDEEFTDQDSRDTLKNRSVEC